MFAFLRTFWQAFATAWRAARNARSLSPRQREIARLAASGLSNEQIARQLHISPETVRSHLNAAFGKLRVHRREDLPKWLSK